MEYVQLTQIQVEAIEGAARCGLLVQIQPNAAMDSEKIFATWSDRIKQTADLVGLGFLLVEQPAEGDEGIEVFKKEYPGREFKLYAPTKLAKDMFNNPMASKLIN